MLAKQNDTERRLAAARDQLKAAEATVVQLAAEEAKVLSDPAAHHSWVSKHAAAIAEDSRSRKLVAMLEDEAARESAQRAHDELQERIAARDRTNAALARRIVEEGGTAVEQLRRLARDVAAAVIEDDQLNRSLPADAERIRGADQIARLKVARPRENISEKPIELWVFASTGNIVGNQGDVIERGNGSGIIQLSQTKCVKRKFRSIKYLEEEAVQRIEPFFVALRLPNVDGPGMAWDGSRISHPAKALDMFAQQPTERQELVELIPVEPWIAPADPSYSHSSLRKEVVDR